MRAAVTEPWIDLPGEPTPEDGSLPSKGPSGGGSRRRLTRVLGAVRSRPARWVFGLLALSLAVWAVASEWSDVVDAVSRLDVRWLVVAVLVTVGNVLLAGLVWRTVLADLGSPLPWAAAARIFFVGQLGKYVPGSVWPLVVQTELGSDHAVPRRRTATATAVALLLSVGSALLTSLIAAPFAPDAVPAAFRWTVLLVIPLAVVLHPAVLGRIGRTALPFVGRDPLEQTTSLRGTAKATLFSIGSWVGAGLQVWALVAAVGGSAGWRSLALAVTGYPLAWVVGFLVVVAPAGAGARELALAAVLGGVLDRASVLVVVLLSRVLFTVVDVAVAGVGLLAGHSHRRVES